MRLLPICLLLLVVGASTAVSAPIKLIYEGIGSGSIGEPFAYTYFTDISFTLTATADTNNRTFSSRFGYEIPHDGATIELQGLGKFDLTSDSTTRFGGTIVSLENTESPLFGLFNIESPVFANWDVLDSIGPIESDGTIDDWYIRPFFTTGGELNLYNGVGPARFTAIVAPEPASVLIFLLMTSVLLLSPRRARPTLP